MGGNGHWGGQKSPCQGGDFEQKFERDEGISHVDIGVLQTQGAMRWSAGLKGIGVGGVGGQYEAGATGGY